VGLTFALLSALQAGSFIGLMLSCAWARMRLSRSKLQSVGSPARGAKALTTELGCR
jgi:hypothetical protein